MNSDPEQILSRLNKPIVMVGLMGAGKTKIGGLLAKSLGLPFIDADAEIERTAGCSIADIFEKYGEGEFRELERKVIARLLAGDIKVVAPGGGALMNDQTAELVHSSALSVWLRADLDILVERTARNNKRPLLKNGDPREILQGLIDKRYPTYAKSDVVVDTSLAEAEHTLQILLKALADYLPATGQK